MQVYNKIKTYIEIQELAATVSQFQGIFRFITKDKKY